MAQATSYDQSTPHSYIGERLKRFEDLSFLTGAGAYTSDLSLPDMAVLAIVRSPHPHARIKRVDTGPAHAIPGVIAAYGARDLPDILKPLPGTPRVNARFVTPMPLAVDVARYVGEPVAVVVAENSYAAEDGAAAVVVEYEPLPAAIGLEQDAHTPVIHDGWPSNVAESVHIAAGDAQAAMARAPVVVEETLTLGRVSAQPMEPRAVVATYDAQTEMLTIYGATQSMTQWHDGLAEMLGLPKERVRVIIPNIGGAFGVKTRMYGEETIVAYLAMRLNRPIKWVADRREEFTSTNQSRQQIHHARIGLDHEGHILAFTDTFLLDAGAYNVSAAGPAMNITLTIHGPYTIEHLEVSGEVLVTNTTPTGPYRGAGRPEAAYIMERMLDRAAQAIGLDPVELRRRNLIPASAMPYNTGIQSRGNPIIYDTGDYPSGFEQVVQGIGYEAFRARQRAAREGGEYLGIGVANCLERSGIGRGDDVRARIGLSGDIVVETAVAQMGQGHPTAYAQIAADRLGAPIERIRVVEGDSATGVYGPGTFASRSTAATGEGIALACRAVRKRLFAAAAEKLEASPDDLEWRGEVIAVRGSPWKSVPYRQLAAEAGPNGIEEVVTTRGIPTFGFQGHGVIVAVDPDLLTVEVHDYVICHDAGIIVNPLIADGQTIGSAVQGLGNAVTEEILYSAAGEPLTTSLHCYVLPSATDTPDYAISEQTFPAVTNSEGFRGLGEGGTIVALPALAQAIEDALAPFGVRLNSLPLTPQRLHKALERAKHAPGAPVTNIPTDSPTERISRGNAE